MIIAKYQQIVNLFFRSRSDGFIGNILESMEMQLWRYLVILDVLKSGFHRAVQNGGRIQLDFGANFSDWKVLDEVRNLIEHGPFDQSIYFPQIKHPSSSTEKIRSRKIQSVGNKIYRMGEFI